MTRTTRILITAGSIVAIVAVAVVLLVTMRSGSDDPPPAADGSVQVVRDNSHRLNTVPDAKATFVEFLDFECEGCRAAYPLVEELRAEYGDRVEFVVRYFPLSGHFNGERAARAVEAAAQQDQFEAMYHKMYETQPEWGEQQVPADDVFRGFASELGLDMVAYDAAYADPATAQRVQADLTDGRALGVQGTPTFFINDAPVELQSWNDLRVALDNALQ